MATKNEITGDTLISKPSSTYGDNFDAIFRRKKPTEPEQLEVDLEDTRTTTDQPIKHTK